MKLYLNDRQRDLILEILRASENNAVNGKDVELAEAFAELYSKISPTNAVYVNLNREDAETIVEFCDIVRTSLDRTITFLEKNTEKSEDEKDELKSQAISARDEIEQVVTQLRDKIKSNPV